MASTSRVGRGRHTGTTTCADRSLPGLLSRRCHRAGAVVALGHGPARPLGGGRRNPSHRRRSARSSYVPPAHPGPTAGASAVTPRRRIGRPDPGSGRGPPRRRAGAVPRGEHPEAFGRCPGWTVRDRPTLPGPQCRGRSTESSACTQSILGSRPPAPTGPIRRCRRSPPSIRRCPPPVARPTVTRPPVRTLRVRTLMASRRLCGPAVECRVPPTTTSRPVVPGSPT